LSSNARNSFFNSGWKAWKCFRISRKTKCFPKNSRRRLRAKGKVRRKRLCWGRM